MRVKINVSNMPWVIALCVFSFPEGILQILPDIFGDLLLICGLIILTILGSSYFKHGMKPSKIIYIECILIIYIIISTLCNNGDILRAIKIGYKMLSASMWADIYFRLKYRSAVSVVCKWSWIILCLNFIYTIFMPQGVYVSEEGSIYSFLNLINNMQIYWIPAYAFCIFNSALSHKSRLLLQNSILFIMVLIPSIVYNNTTGIILSLLMYLLFNFHYMTANVDIKGFIRPKNIALFFVICIGVAYAIVIRTGGGGIIGEFIGGYYTLNARLNLWLRSIEMIGCEPLLGYGVLSSDNIVYYNDWLDYSPHNFYLMVGLWGGIIAIVLYVVLLIIPIIRKSINKETDLFYIETAYIAFIIYLLMETVTSMPMFYILLMSIYHYNVLSRADHATCTNMRVNGRENAL